MRYLILIVLGLVVGCSSAPPERKIPSKAELQQSLRIYAEEYHYLSRLDNSAEAMLAADIADSHFMQRFKDGEMEFLESWEASRDWVLCRTSEEIIRDAEAQDWTIKPIGTPSRQADR